MYNKKRKNTKLHIAMFGHRGIPSRRGGAEVVARNLALRFVAAGHEVTSYNRYPDRKAARPPFYRGIRLRYVPTVKARGLSAGIAAFGAAIRSAFGRYDVVHIHSEGPALFSRIPRLAGKRVIVTIHGLDHQRAKWGPVASWSLIRGEKAAVRWADEIIVLSRSVQDYFLDRYGRKTVYIPNGTEPEEPAPAKTIREKWDLAKDSYVLFLGRLVPEKGVEYLVDAWNRMTEEKKRVPGSDRAMRLVIAGGSSDTDEFVARLKKKAGQDILFTGFVQGETLRELYSNAYIYVLPSDLEGMPLTLLEAMSFGNCCVTSDIPECTEVTESHAASFRKGSTSDLQRRLEQLIGDPSAVEGYRSTAKSFICEKYSWDESARRTMALYRG